MGRSAKVEPITDADEGKLSAEFAQVIAEVGGKYQSKIAALESTVSELRSSHQALELELAQLKSRVLSADRQAPSIAKSAQSTSSTAPPPLQRADSIVEEMATWACNPQQLLPKAVLLQSNVAAVRAIGPAYLQQTLEQQQIDELTKAVVALKEADNISQLTRAEYQLAEAEARKKKVDLKLAQALARVDSVKLTSAEAISPGLARDGEKYTEALTKLVADEPGVLNEVNAEAAAMVNSGALKVGDEVEVVEGGVMLRAKVRRVVDKADGTYELSLWAEVSFVGQKYEAGFDTSQPKLVTLCRRDIYANTKHKQALSKEARALAAGRAATKAKGSSGATAEGPSPLPTTPTFLALLYSDAERTLSLLHNLGVEISTQQSAAESNVAPLKGEARAAFKTLDKYDGDYSRLTDLARMTVQCKTLKDVKDVLKMLGSHKGFAVLLIKNRLMLAFDASVSGGYRDLLLNLRCFETGHIVELQITLKGLIDVKAGSGHANYAIARVHRLFERDTYRYEGALGAAVLDNVRCGVVRELVCRGKASGLAALFDSLLVSLRSPVCGLSELKLSGCDWPKGRALSELIEALPARGLKTLGIGNMQVGGALPEALGDKCEDAELVALNNMGLTGGVPASLGKCTKLKMLMLSSNQLNGSISDELGQCGELEVLKLQQNQLTGGVPASLGKCAKLTTILLFQNQLEGPIPDELGQCGELVELDLSTNQLTGGVPASLGKCTKLKMLQLRANEGLTITASGEQELKEALPSAKFFLPLKP